VLLTLDIPEKVNKRSNGSKLGSGVARQRVDVQVVDDATDIVSQQL
jgi:hypothetical protein